MSCRGVGDNAGLCLLKLGLGSRVLSLKEAKYVCGGPVSTLSQTSPLSRKQKAFLWGRLNREPHGGGHPEPGWRILEGRLCRHSHPSQIACEGDSMALGAVHKHPRAYP